VKNYIAIIIILPLFYAISFAGDTKKAVIDTPTFYHKIDKVEGKNIYLKSGRMF